MMRKLSIGLCLIALSVMNATASESVSDEHEAAEELAEQSAPWNLPAIPEYIAPSFQFDSQPGTRPYAAARLTGRLGYPVNRVARADRLHISFAPGQDTIDLSDKARLVSLLDGVGPFDQIVVTGYAGNDPALTLEDRSSVAQRRTSAVLDEIRALDLRAPIHTDSTPYWAGNDQDAMRAEVFVIRSLAH